MNNSLKIRFQQTFLPWLLVGLPTILVSILLLQQANKMLAIFQNDWLQQGIAVALGISGAVFFSSRRFRIVLTCAIVYFLGGFLFGILKLIPLGEAFAFDLSLAFYIYGALFFSGFILTFAILRWRLAAIAWGLGLLFLLSVLVVRSHIQFTGMELCLLFLGVFFYRFYILLTTELLRSVKDDENKRTSLVLRKTFVGSSILLLLAFLLGVLFRGSFNELSERLAEGHFDNKDNGTSMTKKNKDGSTSNNDRLNLTGGLSKNKTLVFVAHLNNFLPDSTTPNPLYFTAFYYNKFDADTQSFVADDSMPSNDLFKPNPSTIPLYFNKIDTTVIKNSKGTLKRKVASTEVYKVAMSPEDFVAPSTSFLCQPISVPKEYEKQFKSAYRAQMWVSELNSAYFVYNPGKGSELETFQETRYNQLRQAENYDKEDPNFIKYYTQYPKGESYDKISKLAHEIGDAQPTVIDKMLAIRDFFLQKDASGKAEFQYTDNPGLPGIPSANKLDYFLFQNKKGYCAYYAGATLMMLRAMGIPSRIAAGYMTIDRSNKNPGWYWFYADQAHAWVQVYFPQYGWMDFDTTIPDENTQQAPQPDGTPPLGNLQTFFVGDGTITHINPSNKEVDIKLDHFIIQEKTFNTDPKVEIKTDASQAKITIDTGSVDFSKLATGMHVTAASSAQSLKELKAIEGTRANDLLQQLPIPVPVDEIKIVLPDSEKKKDLLNQESATHTSVWANIVMLLLGILVLIIVLFYAMPWIIFTYFKSKAKKSIFYNYRASTFYLYQLGYSRHGESPAVFAEKIDQTFGSDYAKFSQLYQKYKYSKQELTPEEENFGKTFLPTFIQKIKQKIPLKNRLIKFLQPFNFLNFFSQH